jgi:hypothetical protein
LDAPSHFERELTMARQGKMRVMTNLIHALWILVLSATGCAFFQPPPTIEVSNVASVPEGEGIVFGRVKVNDEGTLIDWGRPYSTKYGSLTIVVAQEHGSKYWRYRLSEDGSFYWHLPTGSYSILAFNYYSRERELFTIRPIVARFSIFESKKLAYIGTLAITFIENGHSIRIEDEYEEALDALPFPVMKPAIPKHFMSLEKMR